MKLITENICPAIPVRSFDWAAHFDDEDAPVGYGPTERLALFDLLCITYNEEHGRIIQNRIDAIDGIRGQP